MPVQTTIDLDAIHLAHGSHTTREEGMCVMELAAFLAGRKHSDSPPCVSPAIATFMRTWNDQLGDEDRQTLKPYAARILDTNTNRKRDELARAWLATDWLARTFAPAWIDLAHSLDLTHRGVDNGLNVHAAALRSLRQLDADATADAAMPILSAAESAAWSAAWSAARSAARSAAWSAAESAARSAARSAAWSAAWSAARWSAAWSAAESAARSALAPTVKALQSSALELVDRMIAVGRDG